MELAVEWPIAGGWLVPDGTEEGQQQGEVHNLVGCCVIGVVLLMRGVRHCGWDTIILHKTVDANFLDITLFIRSGFYAPSFQKILFCRTNFFCHYYVLKNGRGALTKQTSPTQQQTNL